MSSTPPPASDATPVPPSVVAPIDPATAIATLADTLGRASTVLYNYRCDNPQAPGLDRMLNLEMALDRQAIALRTQALRVLGDEAAAALAGLEDAARRAGEFLARIHKVEASLGMANAVLGLAGAALVGDAGGIVAAVGHVGSALKTFQAA